MELSRQEYPALLSSISPTQAVNLLNDRVAYIGKLNADVANWLNERQRVEDAYIQGLRRLAQWRGQTTSFGVFQSPWQGLLSSVETIAQSHEALVARIEVDVEKPLRDFTNKNREMQSVTTMKGNLAALAKDFEEAQKKSDKIQGRGNKADTSKLSVALSGVQEAGAQWESQAPFVFESLQALDESRVNHLRDVLTQLQTHEMDLLEKTRTAAASTLELILNVNTSEEISAFVARNAEGTPALQALQRPTTATQPSTPRTALPPPTPTDDRRSEISSTSAPMQNSVKSPMSPPPLQKRSTFGGLKRLGTVMGRRNKEPKSDKQSEKPTPPERKTKTSRNPLRRNSTLSDMHRIPSPDLSAVELGDSSAGQISRDLPATASAGAVPADQPNLISQSQQPAISETAQSSSPTENKISNGSAFQENSLSQPKQARPPSTILEEGPSSSALDAITRMQQEADALGESTQHLKVDIRSDPISEEDSAAQNAAFSNVANVLRTNAGPTPRKQGTVRGRRDVRNTVFVPNGVAPESVIQLPDPSTFPSPLPGQKTSNDERATDAQSIRSAHSLSSLVPAVAHRHPELTQPGLNVSIIETVNSSFHEGVVTKSMVTGEIALLYNGQSASGKETVRLDNFAALHKVAPNPQFVERISERDGEYTIDLQSIAKTQVGFKYQVHLEDAAPGLHSPIVLHPKWKIEPHQASVILDYSWNPALTSNLERITLSNVVIVVSIEQAKAASCMSKPAGTFSKERGQIHWRLGEVVLEKQGAEQRVLARFLTDGEAKPGIVEARWEIVNEHATSLGSNLGLSTKTDDAEKREPTPNPFSDEDTSDVASGFKSAAIVRKLVSGKYSAN